jgi:capsular exopolysaccharide synthesis family protein
LSLRHYLRVLRKRWKPLVAVLLLCTLGGALYIVGATKMYEATAQIFVSTAAADSTTAADLAQGNTFTQARVQSYTSVATSPTVTAQVVTTLGLSMSADELAAEISADAPLNKVLINLHVRDRNPAQAARLANAVATQFSRVVEGLEQTSTATSSPVKLTVTHPAQTPSAPVTPKAKLALVVAVLVGLALGIGFAFLRELLDNTVKDPEELGAFTDRPVLGVVPWDKRATESPISFRADAHGGRAEGFRQLRINLQFVDVDDPPKVIAITSALAGEGKTHTALNLAAALAEAGQRVCLIEADLRKPSLAGALGIVGDVGLTSVLVGQAKIEDVLQNAGQNLAVLSSGPVPPNPSELLNSAAFRQALDYIRQHVDVVVIDTAPLLPVADGAQIAALADATLVTVRAARTTHDQIRRALETLTNVGVTPVGVILSMAPHRRKGGYAYYYEEYRPNRPGHAAEEKKIPVGAGSIAE